MTDPEITALAREYAEEKTDAISFKAYADPEFKKKLHIRGCTNDAKEVIDWLTRRFFLVEKSKAITAYKAMSDYGKTKGVECAECANYAARVWMKRLFPEIAKEVEG